MAIITLVSAKGSPGVTATALAFTLAWRGRTVLAECDPAGGSILPGYLQMQLPAGRGLLPLAIAELRNDGLAGQFWSQLVDLDAPHRHRLLLPGLTDPAQAGTPAPIWDRFAAFFAQLEFTQPGYDVVADCGRLAAAQPPWPMLWAADAVLLVIRPTLVSAAAAEPVVQAVRRQLLERTANSSALALLVVGDGPYSAAELARRLQVPLLGHLPHDPAAAAALTHGGDLRMNRPLLRAAAGLEAKVRSIVAEHRHQVPPQAVRAGAGEMIRDAV